MSASSNMPRSRTVPVGGTCTPQTSSRTVLSWLQRQCVAHHPYIHTHIYIYILYTLGWNEQRKIGRLKSNTNQKLPNGRYSKTVKTFQKYYCLLPSTKSQRLKRYDFFEKNACFTVPIFYTQLLKCQATFHWNVRFKRKRMTYCLSIYVFIW